MDSGQLIEFLKGINKVSPDFIKVLEGNLQQELYKPHQILHAAGHQENRLYFLQSGLARNYYYDHHGNEHSVKFWEAGDLLFSYEGYHGVPSYFYTEILEAAQLLTLSYAKLHELDGLFPETALFIKSVLLGYQREEYQKQHLISLPSEERYLLLRKTKPALFRKVPTRMIASYLHMTRENLTRLIGKN